MKKARKRISLITVIALIVVTVLTVGCSSTPTQQTTASPGNATTQGNEPEYASMTIKVGGTVPESHPITKAQFLFEEIVERESGGAMKVEVYPSGQLGAGREMVEAVQVGNIQMGETTLAPFSSWTDEFSLLALPFLFDNREHAFRVADSEMGKQMAGNVAEITGVRVIGYWENGIRQLTNGTRPVRTPSDLNGMKIRVMENPLYLNLFTAMGANPMPMAFGELYTALQQKTIDGQDNPYAITATNKFYEIQPYMTELGHVFDITGFLINEEWYQSLGEKERALIDKASAEATAYQRAEAVKYETEAKKIVQEEGVEIEVLTPEEREAFRTASASVYDWFRDVGKPVTDMDEFLKAVDSLRQ
ncbi:MAG: TRAP transporter substrate-binding protein [Dethiosulfatibacter sp.]|nr:TRAP transporter substrate-binding protein [Dethiosulfatibacter sp.]